MRRRASPARAAAGAGAGSSSAAGAPAARERRRAGGRRGDHDERPQRRQAQREELAVALSVAPEEPERIAVQRQGLDEGSGGRAAGEDASALAVGLLRTLAPGGRFLGLRAALARVRVALARARCLAALLRRLRVVGDARRARLAHALVAQCLVLL